MSKKGPAKNQVTPDRLMELGFASAPEALLWVVATSTKQIN